MSTKFKFVDRTFNLNLRVSRAILQFFLDRCEPGLFLHFEMIPDRLPESLRELIVKFPPGVLQFEIGVQSFNDDVSLLISRPQDNVKLEENFRFLRDHSGVHIHAVHNAVIQNTVDSLADQNRSAQIRIAFVAIPHHMRRRDIALGRVIQTHADQIGTSRARVDDRMILKEHRR